MPPLNEYRVRATPDRRVLQVYDSDAYTAEDAAWDEAKEKVVGGDGGHLVILSLQSAIPVTVTVRLWDTPPEPPAGAEGRAPVRLDSPTGVLVVNELTRGPAGTVELPAPGLYQGHAWWSGRRAAGEYHDTILEEFDEEEDPYTDLLAAWRACPVEERYVLDLARTQTNASRH
ncbi:hypothetical protein JNUCC64_24375 [Streptomyces sp. JNUCC 64]